MRGRERRAANPTGQMSRGDFEADMHVFVGSFTMTADETLQGIIEDFDRARAAYIAEVAAADPGGESVEPPAPWHGIFAPTPTAERYYLMHHVEEFARHAGHADIIREQIDGATHDALRAAIEGREASMFVTPWTPPVKDPPPPT